jgi:hypothetical protein
VTCYTVPAACEAPFRFAHVHLEGRQIEVWELALVEEIRYLFNNWGKPAQAPVSGAFSPRNIEMIQNKVKGIT